VASDITTLLFIKSSGDARRCSNAREEAMWTREGFPITTMMNAKCSRGDCARCIPNRCEVEFRSGVACDDKCGGGGEEKVVGQELHDPVPFRTALGVNKRVKVIPGSRAQVQLTVFITSDDKEWTSLKPSKEHVGGSVAIRHTPNHSSPSVGVGEYAREHRKFAVSLLVRRSPDAVQ
jgi:hypothetical protein